MSWVSSHCRQRDATFFSGFHAPMLGVALHCIDLTGSGRGGIVESNSSHFAKPSFRIRAASPSACQAESHIQKVARYFSATQNIGLATQTKPVRPMFGLFLERPEGSDTLKSAGRGMSWRGAACATPCPRIARRSATKDSDPSLQGRKGDAPFAIRIRARPGQWEGRRCMTCTGNSANDAAQLEAIPAERGARDPCVTDQRCSAPATCTGNSYRPAIYR